MTRINIGESIAIAMSSLWANRLRTFLTLLGIIIGVLTIIAVVSIIQGLNDYVYTKMSFYGTSDFSVTRINMMTLNIAQLREQMKRKNLTIEDMEYLRERSQYCELIGASVSTGRNVKFGNRSLKTVRISGVTSLDHLIGSVLELEGGRHIRKEDEEHSRYVCIIGAEVKEELFPYLDPLGKRLKVGKHNFTIIGVAESSGKILGMSLDNYVRIPITTFQKIYGSRGSIDINIHTKSQELMELAQDEVRTLLRSKRHVPFDKPDDFSIRTSDTFIDIYKSATTGIYFAMIAISALALVIGGIVVMNIMLVAVTERTNEIGIRMAVGARRKDILFQFLIESATLSTVGGAIGILLGFSLAKAISIATDLPASVEPVSIMVAILVAASVGLFFGIYPANKAAQLDPIEALRSEK